MAFDFDDPPLLPRPVMEWYRPNAGYAINAAQGLHILVGCADLLMRAEHGHEISFAPGVEGRMLEAMGVLLLRAAHMPEQRRPAMFRWWAKRGPAQVLELIRRAKQREGKMLLPEDLPTMWAGCPDGPEL